MFFVPKMHRPAGNTVKLEKSGSGNRKKQLKNSAACGRICRTTKTGILTRGVLKTLRTGITGLQNP